MRSINQYLCIFVKDFDVLPKRIHVMSEFIVQK